MIAQALEFLQQAFRPSVVDVGGKQYSTGKLENPPAPPRDKFPALSVTSLRSLVQYLELGRDGLDTGELTAVVASPTTVLLVYSVEYLDEALRCPYREEVLVARAAVPTVKLDEYISREAFQIILASRFAPTPDREELLRMVGNVEAGATRTHRDDGIAQEVVVRSAVATKEQAVAKPIVELAPFRTFPEVEQPTSKFLFRLKDAGDDIGCALFEADGGAWQIEARQRVAEWLENELAALSIDVPVLQ